MNKIEPLKSKYYKFYMNLAKLTAEQSVATRRQVGTVVVLPTGMLAVGWNGMPAGFDNTCEYEHKNTIPSNRTVELKTKPEVIHAERNALDKLTKQGISSEGAILFTTTAPCMECAKSIAAVGITKVFYLEKYKHDEGLQFLITSGVGVLHMVEF